MSAAHHCPRCDYDLSGETSRWELECPLRGRCPECGLDFAWTHVCHPKRWELDGFVEHAQGFARTFRWAWRTWWWAVLPWRFWNRVQMHHTARVSRMLIWLAIIVGLPHFIGASLPLIDSLILTRGLRGSSGWDWLNSFLEPVVVLNGPWTGIPAVRWTFDDWPLAGKWLVLGVFVLPIALGLMPISLRRAKIREVQVLRAWAYSAAVPGTYFAITALDAIAVYLALNLLKNPYPVWSFRAPVYDAFFPLAGVWLAVWWWFVLTRGWKLRHGWIVWLSILGVVAALALALGGFEMTIGGRIYRL